MNVIDTDRAGRILGDVDDHGPGCGHLTRYRTMAGSVLCELCERRRRGWDFCHLCGRFEPLFDAGWYAPDDVATCQQCGTDPEFAI